MTTLSFHHVTVLRDEAVDGLNIRPGGIYVDCTLGGAGHSSLIASRLTEGGRLIAIDQDDWAHDNARERLAPYMDKVTLVKSNFRHLKEIVKDLGLTGVDGVLFDLGVSSPQLDEGERGFSYNADAPLDMRMDQQAPLSAYDIVNEWDEEEIAKIIWLYGEEKFSRRIARQIVQQRKKQPIRTTGELVELIKEGIPAAARRTGGHPAKRTFQAIRIAVNDELDAFKEAVADAIDILNPGGRVSVITFHSLEDRICKQVYQDYSKGCTCPPSFPICTCGNEAIVKVITRKPILPSEEELAANPRARSAKLRVAEKV
ncbi:16S rRNA (cytosine(1402)-N(4))-methyltransferase RsmH [Brevibacillus agri]|uniref:Ribosomal RNA small subunit methyltransferase H n=1 Tax=Brevibacillus agri TaxID=51101 RepID=A0A3M8AVA3_9BACL|nr:MULTISPECIES: 16S rRNA (cytosine(1402)-N(4))-methyltransferase RsmH [Brevibacillus]MBG9565052.1 16S rRNA methyltransferase [Brevibacillus agri]MBY0051145.1 16S rRNA (cytosine(1402)-N(4))-methyltransferase RsmH [Brevibacillus agri]MCG5250462.1 16S rRNA (cytosine(1402)-N(4))-methyltransferase RsmH [Brevibacillus agri]MDN4092941.1 16S rRNA (cytosine(1402)-N(4))-methyltransferase RsmH [Brevibacillus agri]MDR9502702.1 16S rRNA (cytosine(1402)-N(4))-methyltransferase RsmH [Brevibacillus agri]